MSVTLQDVAETLDLGKKDVKHDKAVYGEVKAINADNTYQVSLNGSDTTVKCARLSGAKVGDTVLVEVLSNGYAVVTGTVGGDTDASDAQRSAAAAQTAAGQAQTAASAAQTAASAAETAAGQAVTKADQASAAAATADSKATAAGTAAAAAQTSADQAASAASTADSKATAASQAASRAETKADTASAAATRAETSAAEAKASASNASEYAARALGNLSTVQNVTETLNWITAHGTMALTSDTDLDPTHVYFVQDNNGDYTVGGTKYAVVTEPDVADISTYYELSIDQSLNNYVATHLSVTNEGLWILPASTGTFKILVSTGQVSAYPAGTYIIDGTDNIVAKYGSTIELKKGSYGVVVNPISNNPITIQQPDYLNEYATSISTILSVVSMLNISDTGASDGTRLRLRWWESGGGANVPIHYLEAKASYIEFLKGVIGTQTLSHLLKITDTGLEKADEIDFLSNKYLLGPVNMQDGDSLIVLQAGVSVNGFVIYYDYAEDTGSGVEPSGNESELFKVTDGNLDGYVEEKLALNTTATSGVDKTLTNAISALGWTSDVIE